MVLRSMFGSLVSGVLAFAAVLFSVPVFLLQAAGLIETPAQLELPEQQVRISRILWIGDALSANPWHHRPMGPDEAALLAEELILLRGEELADARAAKEKRERNGRGWMPRGWEGGKWRHFCSTTVGRRWLSRRAAREEEDDAEVADLAASFSQPQLARIPMAPTTGVVSLGPSSSVPLSPRSKFLYHLLLSLSTYLSTPIITPITSITTCISPQQELSLAVALRLRPLGRSREFVVMPWVVSNQPIHVYG